MRAYLDACCLNRPFDDLSQARVRLEAEAIEHIFERFENSGWVHVSSEMTILEVEAISDMERRERVRMLLPERKDIIALTSKIIRRAHALRSHRIRDADATHVACAEGGRADVLLTCDDKLCRAGRRLRKVLKVNIMNPIDWLREVDDDDDS